ncbi:MAG: phosphate ABC transporter permease PstA [Solirubrobacterales bacterium]|nr:phosphate ABC transporter permease PstA [Solirubrobacterales bacterium]
MSVGEGVTGAPVLSARRRRTDKAMRGILAAATGLALVPLILIIFLLLQKGLGSWSAHFFSSDPTGNQCFPAVPGAPKPPPCDIGGIRSAIVGTVLIIVLASLIAIPTGIGAALYLNEYGKQSRFANAVRYFVDVMTGVPSIVFGLFVYIALVVSHVGGDAVGWKGAVAVSLLMLPIVIRSAEVVLQLVPSDLREAALALGAPRWRVVATVVLPTAASGLVTGSLLAVARGAGETAPLLFTIGAGHVLTANLGQPMNSLPGQIFGDLGQAQSVFTSRAWGAALTLVTMILILNLTARAVSRRSRFG